MQTDFWKRPHITLDLTDSEKGYIAGIFDGEGTINVYAHKSKHYQHQKRDYVLSPQVQVANTDETLIQWIQNRITKGSIWSRICKQGTKPLHTYTLYGYPDIIILLEAILPFLIIKKDHAVLVVEWCKSRLSKSQRCPYDEQDLQIYQKLKDLKNKPKPSWLSKNKFFTR